MQPIQTQLSKNRNKFAEFYSVFPKSIKNFDYCARKD